MPSDTLKSKTAKGLLWGMMNNGAMQLLNIVFGIVLARLLTDGDYGLAGELAIFSALAAALQESDQPQEPHTHRLQLRVLVQHLRKRHHLCHSMVLRSPDCGVLS